MNILRLLKLSKVFRASDSPSFQPERFEAALSGSGGQGIVLAGKILAGAAALYQDREAVMTQSYGPEARGGASKAEVIISSGKIDYPSVIHMDVLLVMTQEAVDKHGKLLSPEGLLVANETFVKEAPQNFKHVFKAPFTSLAIKNFNAAIVSNIIALGALVAITGIVSKEALTNSVLSRVSDKVREANKSAVDLGFKLVAERGFKWKRRGSA